MIENNVNDNLQQNSKSEACDSLIASANNNQSVISPDHQVVDALQHLSVKSSKPQDEQWKIENGRLYFSKSKYPVDTLFTPDTLINTDALSKQLQVVLKTSSDQEYCAIIYTCVDIVNIYHSVLKSSNGEYYGKYLSTLRRNKYYADTKNFILEFVQDPQTGETLILFNKEHGKLSVLKPTGEVLFSDKDTDKFINSLTWITPRYFALNIWFWHPTFATALYDVNELLKGPNYVPKVIVHYDDDIDQKSEIKKLFEVKQGKIVHYDQEYDPDFFEANFIKIAEDTQHKRFLVDKELYGDHQEGEISGIKWEMNRCGGGCWKAKVHYDAKTLSGEEMDTVKEFSHSYQGLDFSCGRMGDYVPFLPDTSRAKMLTAQGWIHIYCDFEYVLGRIKEMCEYLLEIQLEKSITC
jgi:hypothetical protein